MLTMSAHWSPALGLLSGTIVTFICTASLFTAFTPVVPRTSCTPGAGTHTAYAQQCPAPVEAVRERLALVVAANPWLAGRLVRGKGEKRMRLTFDPAGPLRNGLFTVASPGQYKLQGVSYAAIQKVIKGSPLEVLGGVKLS